MAHPELDLKTDRPFQVRFWRFQRFAWIAMAMVLLVALAGLTGKGGPLSRATAAGPQGQVDYPRISRWEMTDEMTVSLPSESTGEVTIEIDDAFSRIFQIESTQPAPKESYVTGTGERLVFNLAEPGGRKTISVFIRPLQPSFSSRIQIRINNGHPLVLSPVVLP
jgi:hypothetical protein